MNKIKICEDIKKTYIKVIMPHQNTLQTTSDVIVVFKGNESRLP